MNLRYNIQIHLPETTNMAVYDAIFQSLKSIYCKEDKENR